MIFTFVFGSVAVFTAVVSCAMKDLRKASLWAWLSSLAVGAIYLDYGVELLAITQWLISTLLILALFFFTSLFGEYGAGSVRDVRNGRQLAYAISAGVVVMGLAVAITIGLTGAIPLEPVREEGFALDKLGEILVGSHALAFEVLAVVVLVAMIGSGVLGRLRKRETQQ